MGFTRNHQYVNPIHLMMQSLSYDEAVTILRKGGVLVFPTETLYGLGGVATNQEAALRVRAVKKRPSHKPLPLIVGSLDQLSQITGDVIEDVQILASEFWPGPLTLLLPAVSGLPSAVVGPDGAVAVRLSGNELARRLCVDACAPLISTSANFSGQISPASLDQIPEKLLSLTDGFLPGPPWPRGGQSSTIIRPIGNRRFTVIREGALSTRQIEEAGFTASMV